MARELLYYHEHRDLNGLLVRLEIHCKDEYLPDWYWDSGIPLQIVGLCGLNLELEGQNGVLNPITKTTLTFSLADCPDAPGCDDEGVRDDGMKLYKHGHWEGFYTPDSEAYLVQLYTGTDAQGLRLRWSGYVTPDSYQEDLGYHAVVSISARDNIGHLYDFDFDGAGTDGLISPRQIITQAMQKVSCPMDLDLQDIHSVVFEGEDVTVNIIDTLIPTVVLEGRTWGEALEASLESIGFVMRWNDNNKVLVCSYRDLQNMGAETPADMALEFYNGTRMYAPACKSIEESISYDHDNAIEAGAVDDHGAFTPRESEGTYNFKLETYPTTQPIVLTGSANLQFALLKPDGEGWTGHIVDVSGYTPDPLALVKEGTSWKDYLFFFCNAVSPSHVLQNYRKRMISPDAKITFNFEKGIVYMVQGSKMIHIHQDGNIQDISYQITYSKEIDGVEEVRFWNGSSWSSGGTVTTITEHFDYISTEPVKLELKLRDCPELGPGGVINVAFQDIHIRGMQYINPNSRLDGVFIRMADVTIESNFTKEIETNTVKTINNEKYNVIIKREPDFAPLPESTPVNMPANYPRAMFYLDSDGGARILPYEAHWFGDTDSKPFPVLVHMQMLSYYHEVLELLEGTCGIVSYDGEPSRDFEANGIFWYKNRRHVLVSCDWDLLSGRLESATFRGFIPYDELWQ